MLFIKKRLAAKEAKVRILGHRLVQIDYSLLSP
jgi:hypothetical protein